jgi:SAM-dependent methyltransferase
MGLYTSITRDWLERRFRRTSPGGVYHAHMPIYGVDAGDCEVNPIGRLARLLGILRQLDGLEFGSLLDVGGAEGYLPFLVRTMYGADVVSTDLSHEACRRAGELFGVAAAAVDGHRLPFADGAFDVVVCSEVIEHVEHPVETILELQRVAARAVVLTTEEVRFDRAAIERYLFRRPGWPHMERNLFHPDDLRLLFPTATLLPQCDERPPDALAAAEARAWVLAHTTATGLAQRHIGVIATDLRPDAALRPRTRSDEALLDALLACTVAKGSRWQAPAPRAVLHARLCDPDTREPVVVRDDAIEAPGGRRYPVRHGVPDFVRLDRPAPARDELAHELERRCPERAAALLELRDRLFLPERWTQDVFDLRVPEHRRGFWANEQLVPREGGLGGFCWRSTGGDPWVVTPCLQRPIHELEIELRIHAPDNPVEAGVGQVFWKGPDDDTFVEHKSVQFRVPNDGKVHVHRVVLAGHPHLSDEVQWLRLDLVDGACEVDFLSMRIR